MLNHIVLMGRLTRGGLAFADAAGAGDLIHHILLVAAQHMGDDLLAVLEVRARKSARSNAVSTPWTNAGGSRRTWSFWM